MKRLSRCLSVALVVVMAQGIMVSCSGSDSSADKAGTEQDTTAVEQVDLKKERRLKSLATELESVNKQLPLEMPTGLTMVKMELKDGYVVTTATYPQGAEVEFRNDEAGKKQLITEIGETRDRLKELGLGVKYVYIEQGTNKETVIEITPEEL